MKRTHHARAAVAAITAVFIALLAASSSRAQSASTGSLKLYIDPKTRQIFPDPGNGRVFLAEVPVTTFDASALERRVEAKTQAQLDANRQEIQKLVQSNEELTRSNADLQREVGEMRPAWRSYIDDFARKFRVGALVYGDYRMYTHTTFQPQELESINTPGPQNNLFNSFDITRTYLNFFFFPTEG